MKKIYTFLFITLSASVLANAQWVKVSTLAKGTSAGDTAKYCQAIKAYGTNIFAATELGLFHSTNNGDTWTNVTAANSTTQGNDNINCLSFMNINSNLTLVIGTASGKIYTTTDNGITWSDKSTGIAVGTKINDINVLNTTFYAAYGDFSSGGVYISNDNCATWTVSNTGLPDKGVNCLQPDVNNNIMYMGAQGVYATFDNGANWTAKNTGLPTAPSIRNIVKKGTALFAGDVAGSGMFKSTDMGANWAAINTNLPGTFCQVFDMITRDGANLYITVDGSPNASAVYESADDGATWSPYITGLPSSFYATCIGESAGGSSLFTFKGFSGDIYRNGGATGVSNTVKLNHNTVSTYPNPAQNEVSIQYSSPASTVTDFELYNTIGKLVGKGSFINQSAGTNTEKLSLQGLDNGIYLLKTMNGNTITTTRVVVQK